MRRALSALAAAGALALTAASPPASAQDEELKTVDIGVVQDSEINVVQKLLYPKAGRSELGFHLGWMPFDAFTTTPVGAVTYGFHKTESLGFEGGIGGGYGLKNSTMRRLEGPAYAVAPDAYRYLASAWGGVEWSPIYAKMNWLGRRVIHHDVFGTATAGATMEQAILPDHTLAVAPTVGLGVGMRFFLGDRTTLRVQLKDDILAEFRTKTAETQGVFIKQNAAITAGLTLLGKRK
ncbi:MAG: outer membrane beta-barrel domain-containing protein [Oligoflexia bacterium]|nr:outer membrane beta-barrel domain-containing protein [Oligoflexia bacterium]